MFMSPAISDSELKSEKTQIVEIRGTAVERLHLLIEASPSSRGSIAAPNGKKQNKTKKRLIMKWWDADNQRMMCWEEGGKPCFKDLDKLRDLITLSDWCLKPWISISGCRGIFGSYVASVSAIGQSLPVRQRWEVSLCLFQGNRIETCPTMRKGKVCS